ncbi:MAG TPA: ComEC/Rec2 family competence protein, partial [Geminicoccaceae bacterium]|nr:ComEC/Rec2 family competence protein [Geminicoccaceae bacterium]
MVMAHRSLDAAASLGVVGDMARRWATASSLLTRLAEHLLAERERWFLWLPVGLGTGVAVYFGLPVEPPVWLGTAGLVLAAALLFWLWWRVPAEAFSRCAPGLLGVLLLLLGFAAASLRTQLVEAPVLERRGAHELTATVLLVEERIRGQRLLLGETMIEGLERHATPAQIRVSTRSAEPAFEPGDRVRMRALLMPPSPPVEPGGFDFARQAYFQKLGAVGYALSAPQLLSRAERRGWSLGIAALRQSIAQQITLAVPGTAGAIGVALLTGLRGALPDQIWDQWAIAGIAHLLSISGLHLALVAGTLFFSVRIALALAPPLALRLPTKKLAALIALVGAFGYLLISGAPVPTQRAFAMTALGLVAIMADRNPFSMRLVAWAAIVVLLLQPESLLGASFQMSFGAVVALIAVYETGVARGPAEAGGLDWRLLMYVGGIALTTLVASAATTPFSIYHFSRFPTYGIATNLIAVPVTGIWIMPWGMLGLLLIPVGLAGPCFVLMGYGIDLIIAAAAFMAELPGAALAVPRPPLAALVATVLGGLWLCLWRTSWRRFGLIGIALGVVLMPLNRPPDLLIDSRGEIVAVRLGDGRFALSPWQRDRWITDSWLQSAGQDRPADWPAPGGNGAGDFACDPLGCI